MSGYGRTDLAIELKDQLLNNNQEVEYEGIKHKINYYENKRIKESIILVKDEQAEKDFGKKKGVYITLEARELSNLDNNIERPLTVLLHERLKKLVANSRKIFVIGLGNRNVTSDALGPLTVDNICVTSHLLNEGILDNKISISALSPGVMAQTGMDTGVILKQICEHIMPDIVIAIDALAAREPERLNTTIQLCDTGIAPGSGVGNNRLEINENTLGIKVIAIGVPTVISIQSIISGIVSEDINCEKEIYNEMYVTPKNIDETVQKMSVIISEAINMFLV